MIDALPPSRPGSGLAKELSHLTRTMAAILVDMRNTLAATAGDPANSRRLSTADTLARLDRYEDPQRAEDFADVSDGDLVKLARQATKLRQAAIKDGRWSPPTSASPAPEAPASTNQVPGPMSVVQQAESPPANDLGLLGGLPAPPQA